MAPKENKAERAKKSYLLCACGLGSGDGRGRKAELHRLAARDVTDLRRKRGDYSFVVDIGGMDSDREALPWR